MNDDIVSAVDLAIFDQIGQEFDLPNPNAVSFAPAMEPRASRSLAMPVVPTMARTVNLVHELRDAQVEAFLSRRAKYARMAASLREETECQRAVFRARQAARLAEMEKAEAGLAAAEAAAVAAREAGDEALAVAASATAHLPERLRQAMAQVIVTARAEAAALPAAEQVRFAGGLKELATAIATLSRALPEATPVIYRKQLKDVSDALSQAQALVDELKVFNTANGLRALASVMRTAVAADSAEDTVKADLAAARAALTAARELVAKLRAEHEAEEAVDVAAAAVVAKEYAGRLAEVVTAQQEEESGEAEIREIVDLIEAIGTAKTLAELKKLAKRIESFGLDEAERVAARRAEIVKGLISEADSLPALTRVEATARDASLEALYHQHHTRLVRTAIADIEADVPDCSDLDRLRKLTERARTLGAGEKVHRAIDTRRKAIEAQAREASAAGWKAARHQAQLIATYAEEYRLPLGGMIVFWPAVIRAFAPANGQRGRDWELVRKFIKTGDGWREERLAGTFLSDGRVSRQQGDRNVIRVSAPTAPKPAAAPESDVAVEAPVSAVVEAAIPEAPVADKPHRKVRAKPEADVETGGKPAPHKARTPRRTTHLTRVELMAEADEGAFC